MLYNVISELENFQNTPYTCPLVPDVYLYLAEGFRYLEDEDLYQLSLQREPRGADKSQIQ